MRERSGTRLLTVPRFLIVLLLLLAVLFFAQSLWLPAVAYALIHDDGPAKADLAVVLGGDYYGHRILKAAELVRQGDVRAVLVSGPPGFYGAHETDLAIPFAVRHGYPAECFIAFQHSELSTRGEVRVILAELRRRDVRSVLLVTSDFHSARAARLLRAAERAAGGGPAFRTVAVPDEFFHPGSWWRSRQGQKTVFLEWSKTVATAFGF
ncbi:MAG TPA: YdcF family protein [Bryobacteraceae bacterium]|nr:YdcF family protein [Bryobacteraceae bacterium]